MKAKLVFVKDTKNAKRFDIILEESGVQIGSIYWPKLLPLPKDLAVVFPE